MEKIHNPVDKIFVNKSGNHISNIFRGYRSNHKHLKLAQVKCFGGGTEPGWGAGRICKPLLYYKPFYPIYFLQMYFNL